MLLGSNYKQVWFPHLHVAAAMLACLLPSIEAAVHCLEDKPYLIDAMEHPTILSEKQMVTPVVTVSDVPSLNHYRPKIVITGEEVQAATEEDVGNAGEILSFMRYFL